MKHWHLFTEKGTIMMNNRFSLFLIGLTLGGVVSALFAPRPGKQTRRLIERSGTAVLDSATDLFEDGRRSIKRASGAMAATVEAWRGVAGS
jgi:gas vesicle protein